MPAPHYSIVDLQAIDTGTSIIKRREFEVAGDEDESYNVTPITETRDAIDRYKDLIRKPSPGDALRKWPRPLYNHFANRRGIYDSSRPHFDIQPPSQQQHDSNTSSGFFTLPIELRDQIYQLVLLGEAPKVCNLFTISKQVYLEAAPVLYGDYSFGLRGPSASRRWFETIGAQNARFVRRIMLSAFDIPPNAFAALARITAEQVPNLRYLTVYTSVAPSLPPVENQDADTRLALQHLRQMPGLKELRVKGWAVPEWKAYLTRKAGVVFDAAEKLNLSICCARPDFGRKAEQTAWKNVRWPHTRMVWFDWVHHDDEGFSPVVDGMPALAQGYFYQTASGM